MEKYQIPKHLIKVEITESAYTENNNRIASAVNTLRSRGLVVMMDDFGCGYSSLNMLENIPVDVLKLDMRFLRFEEAERKKSAHILEAIVNMASMLHLPIVVEGVEDESQEKFIAIHRDFIIINPFQFLNLKNFWATIEELIHRELFINR